MWSKSRWHKKKKFTEREFGSPFYTVLYPSMGMGQWEAESSWNNLTKTKYLCRLNNYLVPILLTEAIGFYSLKWLESYAYRILCMIRPCNQVNRISTGCSETLAHPICNQQVFGKIPMSVRCFDWTGNPNFAEVLYLFAVRQCNGYPWRWKVSWNKSWLSGG